MRSYGDQELRLQQRMAQVSRLSLLGEMTTGLAHELNQPLAAIANFGAACERMLAEPDTDLAPVREALRQIVTQALRAGDALHRLRRLARAADMSPHAADVNALVEEILVLARCDARPHGVRLDFEPDPALPQVYVDGIQIQQVLLNLIRNATEALADQPPGLRCVMIHTGLTPDRAVRIDVSDTGPGVAARHAGRLFEPFFTTRRCGAGLGLAIGRSIMGAHDGTLTFEANRPRGARFIMTLPPHRAER